MIPEKMQTKLVLQTRQGPIELVEPGTKKRKERIIRELKRNAPNRWKGKIVELGKKW